MSNCRARCLAFAAACLLAGCETTGDPRQGGLFGWSESKANERQNALQLEASEAMRASELERARTQDSQRYESTLRFTVEQLRARLKQVMLENQRLELELSDMIKKKTLESSELERVRTQLAENERIKKLAAAPAVQSREEITSSTSMVDQQNRHLYKEILFLLSR